MARIYPFRALRYDTQKVKMEDVVTQPYDKITPSMQQAYYERSPYNLIRVILGKREPTDTDAFTPEPGVVQHNVYTRAAEALKAWREARILREEPELALYGYSQTYQVPGTSTIQERRGFIALGHLYDYSEKVVYRHEQTFPKHKSDRLALFKATRAYCEQIYMLYSDPAFTAEKLIFNPGADGKPQSPADLTITDEYDVVHRVWKLTDLHLINLITTAMRDKKLIIADGHHRYETSVAYMHERAAELGQESDEALAKRAEDDESPSVRADEPHPAALTPPFPEAAMMMTFVNMEAPGITILPTHRVIFGLKPSLISGESWSPIELILSGADSLFDITHLPTPDESLPDLTLLDKTPGVAFLVVTREGNKLFTARPEAIAEFLHRTHPEISKRQASLDVVQLHNVVLEGLLGLTHESIANLENIRYVRDAAEAAAQVHSGKADLAFLIKPVTLDQLRDISLSGDVMPQKSTDFYPKLLSGLAIYALD